jgi:phage host-nuclease inhibitor protein Gam
MSATGSLYADEEQIAESGNSLPSLPMLLYPDFNAPIPSDTEAPATEQFTIDSLSKASWATARILEAEERITQRATLAKEYKDRIDAWLDTANNQDNDSITYLSFLLQPYVESEVSKLHKSKTISLPTGSLSLRKLPERLEITNPTAALTYCEIEHPEAIIIKKDLDKSILKDLILKQAEPIPGVDAELGAEKLYVKPLKIRGPL